MGDYEGLVAGGQDANSFSALFGQPVSSSQLAGIFFRDPSPAESASAYAALAGASASDSAAESNQQPAFGTTVPFSRAEFLTTPASATVSDPVPSPAAIPSRSLPPPAEMAAVDHLFATQMSRHQLRPQSLDWWSDQELGQDFLQERDIF